MKVATYTRISTDEERQPFSLEAQAERLNAYIFSQTGWSLVRSYTDQMSGKTVERPGLQRALQEARASRYELLLVFKVDRLARSTGGLAQILEELDKAGVAFRSASEPFETTTAAGRMMVQMLGVFAEFEREMIVERTKMGLGRKAAKGEWTGGVPPFGYRYDADQRLLVPVEHETQVVRSIFENYAKRKWGSMTIAKSLNDKYELTRRGAYWTPKKIISVLRNPTYVGLLPFNGEVYAAHHEAIIDTDLFKRVTRILDERAESWSLRAQNPTDYLLTSLMKCKRCNHGFVGAVAHGRNQAYRYYTCFSRHRHGTARCDQERIPADVLEDAIITETLAELDDGSLFKKAAERALAAWDKENSGKDQELRALTKRIDDRRRALDRYLKAFESGRLSEVTCSHRVKDVEHELKVLEAEKATLEGANEPPEFSEALLKDLRTKIEEAVTKGSPQEVKHLLGSVVDSIVVESLAFIQPFFSFPPVRTLFPSRRRTGIEPAHRLSPAHWF